MYRIDILTDSKDTGEYLRDQTLGFCSENGIFPVVDFHLDQETYFNHSQQTPPSSVILALAGVAGLNAAEHLRSLFPDCGLIWCSDLDFSLHAFRLRAEYFILSPFLEKDLREGLSVWMARRKMTQ